ncbi:hypothetical protein HOLleu_26029 [Holothuria leucospilota]|uniref:Uncharacterized protein n=1 Tax=Holothuria leucospilota TaxID=206669 RepID=A0A9Q1H4E6_HOLLE|nr:hypothetical protein HOLleu_26029 [Holothuria leucospilota]
MERQNQNQCLASDGGADETSCTISANPYHMISSTSGMCTRSSQVSMTPRDISPHLRPELKSSYKIFGRMVRTGILSLMMENQRKVVWMGAKTSRPAIG